MSSESSLLGVSFSTMGDCILACLQTRPNCFGDFSPSLIGSRLWDSDSERASGLRFLLNVLTWLEREAEEMGSTDEGQCCCVNGTH